MRTPAGRYVLASLVAGWPINPEGMAGAVGIARSRAAAWLRQLERQGVLASDHLGGFSAGPQADGWMGREPKTNEGGNARSYRSKKAFRELMDAAMHGGRKIPSSRSRRERAAQSADLTSDHTPAV